MKKYEEEFIKFALKDILGCLISGAYFMAETKTENTLEMLSDFRRRTKNKKKGRKLNNGISKARG